MRYEVKIHGADSISNTEDQRLVFIFHYLNKFQQINPINMEPIKAYKQIRVVIKSGAHQFLVLTTKVSLVQRGKLCNPRCSLDVLCLDLPAFMCW